MPPTGIPKPKTTLIPIPKSPTKKNNVEVLFANPDVNVGGAVGESDQPLWKQLYTQALLESDKKKVTLLVLAADRNDRTLPGTVQHFC